MTETNFLHLLMFFLWFPRQSIISIRELEILPQIQEQSRLFPSKYLQIWKNIYTLYEREISGMLVEDLFV